MDSSPLRLGTRSSKLARAQADWVAGELCHLGHTLEVVEITTRGDQQAGALGTMGGEGLFTKELERALLSHTVDFAVHSLKDLPTESVDGLKLTAVPLRASAADVLVSNIADSLQQLSAGSRVGTGSIRRIAQLLNLRPDLQLVGIRGNIDTRLAKLDDGQYDAIILAEAGLQRLNLEHRITQSFSTKMMLPAVGQGALGLECRIDDQRTTTALAELDNPDSHAEVSAERSLLAHLRAGCSAPVGALATIQPDGDLKLVATVLSGDGQQRTFASAAQPPRYACELGQQVAEQLLSDGAAELIATARPPE
jgi:hydroxymethylbilane synthase